MGVFKKGKNWYIDFYYKGKRYRKKVGPVTKTFAKLALKQKKIEIAKEEFLGIKQKPKILFDEMANDYLEKYSKINKQSYRSDKGFVKNLLKFFGGKYLSEISPLMIEEYKRKRLSEGVLGTTVNHELSCLRAIFNKAIEWGKAEENPVRKVKFFKEQHQRVRYLEKGEIEMLLECCPEWLKPIVIIAMHTGLRRSEILNLVWDDIDFEKGLVRIRESKNYEQRFVPMNTTVCSVLENLKEICNPDSPYVFASGENKRPFSGSYVSHAFNRVVKKAGIKDFRFHDLRHTFASHLVMNRVGIDTVRDLLGHKTLKMTVRYSHLSPEFRKAAVEILSARLDTIWTPKEEELKK